MGWKCSALQHFTNAHKCPWGRRERGNASGKAAPAPRATTTTPNHTTTMDPAGGYPLQSPSMAMNLMGAAPPPVCPPANPGPPPGPPPGGVHPNLNASNFKTRLCTMWQQSGACIYGNTCAFAHGVFLSTVSAVLRPYLASFDMKKLGSSNSAQLSPDAVPPG